MTDEEQAKAASALLVKGAAALVALGGSEAAAEVLRQLTERVRAGHYQEGPHVAGHA